MLVARSNLANRYSALGRLEEALLLRQEVYARTSALHGLHGDTLLTAANLASTLVDDLEQLDEARAFLRDRIPEAMRVCGKDHDITFKMQRMYAQCLFQNDGASRSDLTEAVAKLEDLARRQTRIFGASHPQTDSTRRCLQVAREKLARA